MGSAIWLSLPLTDGKEQGKVKNRQLLLYQSIYFSQGIYG